MDKGVKLDCLEAQHPFIGSIPVYASSYVFGDYGNGAVMGVPAHDERDFEFANLNNLSITQVISSDQELPYTGDGTLINSGEFDGLSIQEA